ncbi:MAG: LTA synthase family protein [Bacteroidetes bacterium]|nr:LTA synthase family protein [Bacteroidota bacterium]
MKFLLRVYILGLVIFFIYRVAYMFRVLSGEEIGTWAGDIGRAFITALRFDTATICYGLLLPVVLSFICLAGERSSIVTAKIQKFYITLLLLIFTLVLIVDYYYYTYFQSHITVQIFGFMEDDTAAVMKSLWTDYPLLKVILGIILCGFIFSWMLSKIQKSINRSAVTVSTGRAILFSVSIIILFALGLRSSFGTFPVQMDDASVSGNAKVNLLPINGVFALKDAIVYHKNEFQMDHVLHHLGELGYKDRPSALKDYLETNFITPVKGLDSLYTMTDSNVVVKRSPPNVIFFLLESWSNNNLYLHSKDINLLGSLEKYWNSDILFRNFLSGHNGTINSIEGMMINTPVTPVAQSEYSDVTFESSCAKPFYEKGYATTFISGGKINWRNINNFIPRQYFEYVEGNADIKKANQEAHECEWGVYDEYVFTDVFRKLSESKGNPQFIFALTTTNHTPFHLPDHYKPYPVKLSPEIKGKLKVDEELSVNNLINLQYTNDCLGKFLEALDNSPYAENTIVVATGDHNNLMLFDFDESKMFYRYSVPLLVHVPEKYLYKSEIDTSRWGSHKDIFPTIYNLALDSAPYFNNGNNLFEKSANPQKFFALNIMGDAAMNNAGAVRFNYEEKFLQRNGDLFQSTEHPDSALKLLMKRSRAYFSMMTWNLKEEVERHHSKSFLKK